jgi:LIM domain-containing protein 2
MYTCFKCKKLIKPVSLAATVAGESFHPHCISCFSCNTPLFGKQFKKGKGGQLFCENGCQTAPAPPASAEPAPRAENKPVDVEKYRKPAETPRYEPPRGPMKPDYGNEAPRVRFQDFNDFSTNKQCKSCSKPVAGRTFITYENGDILCYDCEMASKVKPPRAKSAHIVICSLCNKTVHGRRYFTEPSGKIVCDSCEANAPKCAGCSRPLGVADEAVRKLSNGSQFHEHCFSCSSCGESIGAREYFEDKSNNPLCLKCFEVEKLPKCSKCARPATGDFFMADNKPIHGECFMCDQCGQKISMEDGYFKSASDKPICKNCNLANNGVKCGKCKTVIEKDGYTFANRDYHEHCFTCVNCQTMLSKMKKAYRGKNDEEILCEPCFVDKYAPRCEKCGQPISPHLPGTKYEDKMYHRECLACARCKKTLANKKFFKSGNILICESCY